MQRPLLLLLALSAPLLGQQSQPDPRIARYGIPQVDEVHLDAYADFRDYVDAGDWSRAFRSIGTQLDEPPPGMVPSEEGIALVWRERIARDLRELEREGWNAFQIFYDSKASKLLEDAPDDAARLAAARHVYESYFPTHSGDDAAVLLARAAMLDGRPTDAAEHLLAVLDYHADTEFERAALWVEYARAVAAAGDHGRFADCESMLSLRYGGGSVELAGEALDVDAELVRLAAVLSANGNADPYHDAFDGERFVLAEESEFLWRKSIASYKEETQQWRNGWQTESKDKHALPGSVTIGDLLVLNSFGRLLAVRPATGEVVWESGGVPEKLMESGGNGRVIFFGNGSSGPNLAGRFSVQRAGERLIAVGDVRPGEGRPLFNLVCIDSGSGDFLWSTAELDDWKDVSATGHPGIGAGVVFTVIQRVGNYDMALRALSLEDGSTLWETALGSPATSGGGGFHTVGPETLPTAPVLHVDGAHLYVMTDAGALFAIGAERGTIDWAFTYDMRARASGVSPGSLVVAGGEVLVFRSRGSRIVHALDPRTRTLRWTHKLPSSGNTSRVVGCDGRHVFLLGDGITCLDAETGERRWSRPLAVSAGTRRMLFGREHLYVSTTRGLFELRKKDGFNETIVRDVRELGGGDLLLAQGVLCLLGREEIGATSLGD